MVHSSSQLRLSPTSAAVRKLHGIIFFKYNPNDSVNIFKLSNVGPINKTERSSKTASAIFAFDRNLIPLPNPDQADNRNKIVTIITIINWTIKLILIPKR